MGFSDSLRFQPSISPVQLLILTAVFAGIFYLVFIQRPAFTSNAPKVISSDWPIVGALKFWTARRDFWIQNLKETATGNFSYHLGKHRVVGVFSKEGRDAFFFNRDLNMAEGYAVLFGQSPRIKDFEVVDKTRAEIVHTETFTSFNTYFTRRIVAMLSGERLAKAIPTLVTDVRGGFDELGESGLMDPFVNLFEMVYVLTQRTVGSNEIANSRPLMGKTLSLFQMIEKTSTSYQIIFPWLPSPAMFKRVLGGSQLYFILNKIINARKKEGRREADGLQFLLDQGDDLTRIIGFTVGALFAGQLNTGITTAAVVCYLAVNPKWIGEIRREITAAVERYTPGDSSPLPERLAKIPLEGWEKGFPTIDNCMRETIRLQLPGTEFRRNTSKKAVRINEKEEIPPGSFVTYHIGQHHLNPDIFPDPYTWDPARFQGPDAVDKRIPLSFIGWGIGRHPCLGMRFAKLEQNIILSYFLALFDFELCDAEGKRIDKIPDNWENHNGWNAAKPDQSLKLKYSLRKDNGL